MEFGWISLCNILILAGMLIPNICFALHSPGQGKREQGKWITVLEQIGRYGSMALMVLPLGVWKFGFPSVAAMLLYITGNLGLLIGYLATWFSFSRKPTPGKALALAILPTIVFLLCGLTLSHPLLVGSALLFGAAHIPITWRNFQS